MVDHIGHPFVGLELAVFSLSSSWIYKQVRWNEKFWVMCVTFFLLDSLMSTSRIHFQNKL